MKLQTPEIRWHADTVGKNQPVLAVDFAPATTSCPDLFVTGGADTELKLWTLERDENTLTHQVNFLHSLTGHDRTVNVVRFSPNGECLASASDDATIIIWVKPREASSEWSWKTIKCEKDVTRIYLKAQHGDIYDLAWSPDSTYICSGSVDNSGAIYNVVTGKLVRKIEDHSHFVQGVAWDPQEKYLATQSSDRTCRIHSLCGFSSTSREPTASKKVVKKISSSCLYILRKRSLDTPEVTSSDQIEKCTPDPSITLDDLGSNAKSMPKSYRLYVDENFPSFFRRLTWTPDGSFLLSPSGLHQEKMGATTVNTVHVYSRELLSTPLLHLPGSIKPSVAIRCSPIVYKLRMDDNKDQSEITNVFRLPYRLIFAVVTLDSIVIYDTQQSIPLLLVSGIHYAEITDVSWSSDGRNLICTSSDGYCSILSFDEDDFGELYPSESLPCFMKRKHVSIYNQNHGLYGTTTSSNVSSKPAAIPNIVAEKKVKKRRIFPTLVPDRQDTNVLSMSKSLKIDDDSTVESSL